MSALEAAAVLLAIAYLVLAIRQNVLCWAAALASSVLYVVIFFQARLYMESLLNGFYAAMAVYGWYQWTFGGGEGHGLRISTWTPTRHIVSVGFIVLSSMAFGFLLSRTEAAFPFLDSFTSVAAIVATYMVARKILENWLYWFVIDALSVYLYQARGLSLTALLFVLYLALIVIGFRRWWKDWRAQEAAGTVE